MRKDNFEKLKFSNFGQTYNSLTYNYLKSSLPAQSFSSKQHAYISSDDVNYYNVPTPLTELLFKTVMKQGQFTNAMFSTNMSENFNFSIGFNGMRSLEITKIFYLDLRCSHSHQILFRTIINTSLNFII